MKALLAAGEALTLMVWQAVMMNSRRVPHVCQAAASGSSAMGLLHTPSAVACQPTAALKYLNRLRARLQVLYVKWSNSLPPSNKLAALALLGQELPLLWSVPSSLVA